MKLTAEELQKIEEVSELHLSIDDIAIFIQREIDEVKASFRQKEAIYYAVMRGRLKTEIFIRKTRLQQAKQGSTPAQADFDKLILKTKIKEM